MEKKSRARHLLSYFLFLICLLALLYPPAKNLIASEANWREVQTRGALRVGIDPNWQPFSFYNASGWDGFDADLARELAKRLNLRLTSDPVGYDSMYDALAQDRVDVVISAVVADGSRAADFAWSTSYFEAGVFAVAPAPNGFAFLAPEQLQNKRVAAALGGEADRMARFWERRAPGLTRAPAQSEAESLQMLADGRADAAFVSRLELHAPVPPAARAILARPFVIAAKKQNTRLLAQVNRVLEEMQKDGSLAAISQKWTMDDGR